MSQPYQANPLSENFPLPRELRKLGRKELKITWQDGHLSVYGFRYLRTQCQCAFCVEEITGRKLLVDSCLPEVLEGMGVSVVGQYALRIDFSDGHNSGIYAYKHLRKACPCELCRPAK